MLIWRCLDEHGLIFCKAMSKRIVIFDSALLYTEEISSVRLISSSHYFYPLLSSSRIPSDANIYTVLTSSSLLTICRYTQFRTADSCVRVYLSLFHQIHENLALLLITLHLITYFFRIQLKFQLHNNCFFLFFERR